jgi:membrane-bound lytic murein transglycosylase B
MNKMLLIAGLLVAGAATASDNYANRADVRDFIDDMVSRHGLPRGVLERDFARVRHSPPVLKAILPPADPRQRSWLAYRARFVEATRIARGRAFMNRHHAALARAEADYGVPAAIIAAIIGVETLYGRDTGHFHVFNALSNLAFDYPPRAQLFRHELEELLLLAREQRRPLWTYRGSYAGAMGLPQFLPSSTRNFAVDFDDNGRIDLEHSAVDSIGSVASFLRGHGWVAGAPILDPAPAEPGEAAEGTRIVELESPGDVVERRLAHANFDVLLQYNRSRFYASAVADLARAIDTSR